MPRTHGYGDAEPAPAPVLLNANSPFDTLASPVDTAEDGQGHYPSLSDNTTLQMYLGGGHFQQDLEDGLEDALEDGFGLLGLDSYHGRAFPLNLAVPTTILPSTGGCEEMPNSYRQRPASLNFADSSTRDAHPSPENPESYDLALPIHDVSTSFDFLGSTPPMTPMGHSEDYDFSRPSAAAGCLDKFVQPDDLILSPGWLVSADIYSKGQTPEFEFDQQKLQPTGTHAQQGIRRERNDRGRYECLLCGRDYKRTQGLMKHRNKFHGEEDKEKRSCGYVSP